MKWIIESTIKHVNEEIRERESELLGIKTQHRTLEADKAAGKWINSWHDFVDAPEKMKTIAAEIEEAEAFRAELLGRLK